MRKQFTFYESYWFAVKKLQKQRDRLSALEAICAYAIDGEEIPMTDAAEAVFTLIKPVLDTAEKRAISGKQGGSKPKAKRKQTLREKEGEKEVEKESYDFFSTEKKSESLASSRLNGGDAALPDEHDIVYEYREFDV